MVSNSTQLAAISRMFSPAVFRELATRGRSSLFARLYGEAEFESHIRRKRASVGVAFDTAFSLLRQSGIRNEYVYRSALTHNVLLGTHSLKTASMLTEFRVGACKADLAILNGTATVYEIKSDRDSLSRLANQIENYSKVFAKIYVIAGKAHVAEVKKTTPKWVGVMSLARWDRICIERDAKDRRALVDPVTIFESIRSLEAQAILKNLNVRVPDVPNTRLHDEMKHIFAGLSPLDVQREMVTTLKCSRSLLPLGALIQNLPRSLQPAALLTKISRADHERLIKAVKSPLSVAAGWA